MLRLKEGSLEESLLNFFFFSIPGPLKRRDGESGGWMVKMKGRKLLFPDSVKIYSILYTI
jgi:hypothetical protein